MTYFEAIILGLTQGLAEFLPISSSGHLAILQYFFEIDGEKVLPFAVLLHVGTLFSVLIVYRKELIELIIELGRTIKDLIRGKGLRLDSSPIRRLGAMIIVATIPTAFIGLIFHDFFESMYSNLAWIALGLVITGFLLLITENYSNKRDASKLLLRDESGIKIGHAILIGVFQGIAIWPGISRSGSTLAGGLLSGLDRNLAIKFAFLISIPSIFGSALLEAPDAFRQGMDIQLLGPVLVGVLIAGLSGYFAIKTMLRIVRNKSLYRFSIYVWILALFLFGYLVLA